ncbi:DUF1194 domain-containing protein [Rhodobacteraceae bacterium 2CG4]|uniref:DUF1194 domain-containing protein n=1 Tax=Halovulum marinum TaxID=2662447 RepID=A0A6L5YUQ1_9RHOB|nr:DUF1194 domain-containing protein [Halovulum marinum]MSU87997.1 DUF1194 domain-containing protein [Halovulum marinum]
MIRALALAVLLALAGPAAAQCRLALTLALDVSSSVDAREYRLQLEGLARAFEDRQVRAALFALPSEVVALQVYEWSGIGQQALVQDWVELRGAADLDRLVARLRTRERGFADAPTALGAALRYGLAQLRRAPACAARKIDVSGDGQSNVGPPPQALRIPPALADLTINGLAIESDEVALARYYRSFVVRGPGAFVEVAADFDDYARAIRAKLIRELGVPRLGALR